MQKQKRICTDQEDYMTKIVNSVKSIPERERRAAKIFWEISCFFLNSLTRDPITFLRSPFQYIFIISSMFLKMKLHY